MNLDAFFEKFELFADAPNAVQKMRELILHLAFSGGWSNECNNWKKIPLKQLSTKIGSGSTPDGGRESYFDIGIPLIRSMNVYFSGFRHEGLVFLNAAQAAKLASVTVHYGDVLLNITGASIGRVTVAPQDMVGARVNQHVCIIRSKPEIDSRFLTMFLAGPTVQNLINEIQVGATRQALTKAMIEQFEIPLPPLAEQKRIVEKVDELMALCDRLEAQQQECETRHTALAHASLTRFADAPTPANLELLFHKAYSIEPVELRKRVLSLAVEGNLVPQDPMDEQASILLERIANKKQALTDAKKIRQGKVSRPQTALAAPASLPSGWEWVNIDSLCFKVTDGTHFTPKYVSSGIRFVSAKDIVSGKISFAHCKYISQEEHDQLYRRCNPEYHDIVISKSGSIGTVALVEDHEEFSLFESLALLKFDQESLFPRYFVYALTHMCSSLTAGHIRGVGVKHLHLDMLRGLELAPPPLPEQRRIVAKVDQLMALVDQLEAQLVDSRAKAAALMEAVVAELSAAA